MAVSAGMVAMPVVYTVLALLLDRANSAVLITDSKADAEVLGSQSSSDTPSSQQRARLVRRESGDADVLPSTQAADDKVEREAVAKAVDAAGQKAASEAKFKAITEEFEAEIHEADQKRLAAEERVKSLETDKARKTKQKQMQKEKPAAKTVPVAKDHDKLAAPNMKASKVEEKKDLLVEKARQKAMEEEREKLDSMHGQDEKREVRLKAEVSGLPAIAFSKDAYILDKDQAYANLIKRLASEQRGKSGSHEKVNWCDRDYPLGHWNSSLCSSDGGGAHTLVLDQAMCAAAAQEANATAHDAHFVIPDQWADMHPKGCFVFPCSWDAGGVCYWFNSIGDTPSYPWGAPVCQRPKFQNGTANTNSGCPRGYDVILNANNCTESAGCQGYCTATDFVVGGGVAHNESLHNIYPEGCFVDNQLGCVKYNPVYGPTPPQAPKGTPLCNVTSITHFPEITLPFDVFW